MPTYISPESQPDTPGRGPHPLEVFFAPESVAIFGATEATGSAGRAVMANLIRHPFGGTLFPINPHRPGVLGVKAYPDLKAVPTPVELAIVTTPAPAVPDVIGACAAAGVKGALIVSAGFGESGTAGAALAEQLAARLRGTSLRVLGPNSLGLTCPRTGINATIAPALVRPGRVGFLSQSGALLAALLSPDLPESVGCSAFVSLGAMIDLGWEDWLDYLANDPQTEVIGIYAETLGEPRSFFRAVQKVSPHKPVVLVKGGRTEAGAAVARYSGPLAERDDVLEDLFRRSGVLRVDTLADLMRMAGMLATQPAPRGRRLTIVSNGRGPAALAADALVAEGGALTPLAPGTTAALDALLPVPAHRHNPLDIGEDADADRYARAVLVAADDPNTDALLLILTPQATIDPLQTAVAVSRLARGSDRPLLACWMWGAASPASLAVLNQVGVTTFAGPETAVRALGYLWRHGDNVQGLAEPRTLAPQGDQALDGPRAEKIVAEARRSGRTVLTGAEAQELLAAYALPAVETRIAGSPAEAVALADGFGYPVVLGPLAEGEGLRGVGDSVQLFAADEDTVRWAHRTLKVLARDRAGRRRFQGVRIRPAVAEGGCAIRLQSLIDPQLGPVLRLGAGGRWATGAEGEVIALPPLSVARVRQLLARVPPGAVLRSLHGRGLDLATLEQFLVRFSRLVVQQRWIKEICIDPLLASRERVVALDARVVLHGTEVQEEHLPEPVLCCEGPREDLAGSVSGGFRVHPPLPPRFYEAPSGDEVDVGEAAFADWRFSD